jgi:hypothetical protein
MDMSTKKPYTFEEFQKHFGKMEIVNMPGDGNCLYHSLCYFTMPIYAIGNPDEKNECVTELRNEMAIYVQDNQTRIKEYFKTTHINNNNTINISARDPENYEELLIQIKTDNIWGGAYQLMVFKALYPETPIIIISKGNGFDYINTQYYNYGEGATFPVESNGKLDLNVDGTVKDSIILYYNGNAHYDAVKFTPKKPNVPKNRDWTYVRKQANSVFPKLVTLPIDAATNVFNTLVSVPVSTTVSTTVSTPVKEDKYEVKHALVYYFNGDVITLVETGNMIPLGTSKKLKDVKGTHYQNTVYRGKLINHIIE